MTVRNKKPPFEITNTILDKIAEIAAKTENISQVQIMAYHKLGLSKYHALGSTNSLEELEGMEKEYKKKIAEIISAKIKPLTDRKIKVE